MPLSAAKAGSRQGGSALRRLLVVTLAMLLFAGGTSAVAGTISIAWDPVSDADLAGYKVYYGLSPDALDRVLTVSKNTTAATILTPTIVRSGTSRSRRTTPAGSRACR